MVMCLLGCLHMCLSVCVSVFMNVCVSFSLFFFLSVCRLGWFVCIYASAVFVFASLLVCLSGQWMSVCLPVCLIQCSAYLLAFLLVCLPACPPVSLSACWLSSMLARLIVWRHAERRRHTGILTHRQAHRQIDSRVARHTDIQTGTKTRRQPVAGITPQQSQVPVYTPWLSANSTKFSFPKEKPTARPRLRPTRDL